METRDWWTPNGWEQADEPEPWGSLQEFGATAIRDAGYYTTSFGGEDADGEGTWMMQVLVYRHPNHLVVAIDQPYYGTVHEFFVRQEHKAAFFVDKLPSLVAAIAAIQQAESSRLLAKAAIAYVRHGHGVGTISRDGVEDADEKADRLRYG